MKNNFLPDFRRETQELLKENKISALTIIKTLGVSQATAYNWINGKKSPSRRNFLELKKLAGGSILGGTATTGEGEAKMISQVLMELGAIKERLARVESEFAEMKKMAQSGTPKNVESPRRAYG